MKTNFYKYYVFLLTLIMLSCNDGNYVNVSLEGYIKDAETKEIIPKSNIQVLCWAYDTEIWESKKVEKEVLSDEKGFYLITFDKGEVLEILVSSDNYVTQKISIKLKKSKNKMNFFLEKD